MNILVTLGDNSKKLSWNVEFDDIRNFCAYGAVVLLSKSSSERTYLDVKVSRVLLLVYLGVGGIGSHVVWRFDLVVSDDVVSPRWGE